MILYTGSGNCVVLESPAGVYKLDDCFKEMPYICQTSQTTTPDEVEKMGIPEYVHPLNNITDNSIEHNVGFSNISVWQTELSQPSIFKESAESYIEVTNTKNISSKYGLTIGMWIRLRTNSTERIPIWDSGSKDPLYIYFRYNEVRVRMCNNIACSDKPVKVSHKGIQLHVWTFIALTFDTEKEIGILFINETYGSNDAEGSYINFKTNGWFKNYVVGQSMKIGATNVEKKGFLGEISCLQVSNKFLSPAQVYQLSKICHVDINYERAKPCPIGYKVIHQHCYKLSSSPMTYTDAELSCLSDPSDAYVTQLNIPTNFEIQNLLVLLVKQALNESQIWIGLDSMSGKVLGNVYYVIYI